MYFVDALFLWIGAVSSLASLLIYGLSAKWWRNAFGRMFVIKDFVITLFYLRSVLYWLGGNPIQLTPVNIIFNVAIGTVFAYKAVTLAWMVRRGRHREKRSQDEGLADVGN